MTRAYIALILIVTVLSITAARYTIAHTIAPQTYTIELNADRYRVIVLEDGSPQIIRDGVPQVLTPEGK